MTNLILILSSLLVAQANQKAHVHGAAEVSIAFDKNIGKIVLNTPADSIYGFEYVAKTKKDKQRKEDGLNKLAEKMSEMIVFPESSSCTVKKDVFEVNETSGHADIVAEFKVDCKSSPVGGALTFNFQNHFRKLKNVKVDVLADDVQKSIDVKTAGEKLELK